MIGRLGWNRQRARAQLDQSATLIHRRYVDNDDGGRTLLEEPEAEPVPSRVVTRTVVGQSAQGAQPVAITLWEVYLPYGTAVGPRDLIEIGGTRYEVIEDDDAVSDGVTLTVQVRRTG